MTQPFEVSRHLFFSAFANLFASRLLIFGAFFAFLLRNGFIKRLNIT